MADIMSGGSEPIDPRDSLIESGIMDSMGLVSLLSYLEQEFSISIDGDELVPENFETIESIASFVHRKLRPGE